MINHKFFSNSYLIFVQRHYDVIITLSTRQPPAEENKYATGIYYMFKSRFFLENKLNKKF